jgi:hypothetical protein
VSTSPLWAQTPTIGGCAVFPADNVWNAKVDKLPVDRNSNAYVQTIGASSPLHPDFGTGYGIPVNSVNGSQTKVSVSFSYAAESDAGPYPIPSNVAIEGGSDRHALIVDTTNCVLYELYGLWRDSGGKWYAGSGAIFRMNSDSLRAAGWTSADAAGLPITPGLVRWDEILSGHINHAIRFTAPQSRNTYIWPARHAASSLAGTQYPPFGQRFRLKANYDISSFPPHAQVVLQALKTYGMILADNGASWFITGAQDSRVNDTEMHTLTRVAGADFEAVDESSLMANVNSAQVLVTGSAPPPPNPGSVPSGWVNIVSKNSGKCLGVVGGSGIAPPLTPFEQATCINGTHQEFQFSAVSGGYKIIVRSSGQSLDVRGGPTAIANGVLIEQYPFWGGSNEIWNVARTSDGYFQITATSSSKCMDVQGISKLDHALIQQWSCWGGDNQKWSFVPAD